MTGKWIALAEMILVLGLALGWAAFEVLKMRRYRRKLDAGSTTREASSSRGIGDDRQG